MANRTKLVVVGYGGMGGWHCHFQRSNDVVNLKGVYDIKPERNKAAEEMGIYAYPSFEAVLADPEVDFLVIAVPNDMHTILKNADIMAIFCTGTTAAKLYKKFIEPETKIPAITLPSTSPANAKVKFDELTEEYKIILEYLK